MAGGPRTLFGAPGYSVRKPSISLHPSHRIEVQQKYLPGSDYDGFGYWRIEPFSNDVAKGGQGRVGDKRGCGVHNTLTACAPVCPGMAKEPDGPKVAASVDLESAVYTFGLIPQVVANPKRCTVG